MSTQRKRNRFLNASPSQQCPAVWRLFVGAQPTIEDNKLYARFRAACP